MLLGALAVWFRGENEYKTLTLAFLTPPVDDVCSNRKAMLTDITLPTTTLDHKIASHIVMITGLDIPIPYESAV